MSLTSSSAVASPYTAISERLRWILGGLRTAAAARAGRRRDMAPMVLILWSYLHRVQLRFDRLLARLQAGDRAALPRRPTSTRPPPSPPPTPPPAKPRLPRGFGWLIPLLPVTAASYGGNLSCMMAEPEMAALLATDPRARRILAPLCRMLGQKLPPAAPPAPSSEPDPPASATPTPLWAASRPEAPPAAPDDPPPPGFFKPA